MSVSLANDVILILPLLVICVGSFLLMILEVTLPKDWPRALVTGGIILSALIVHVLQLELYQDGERAFSGLMYADPYASFLTFIVLISSILALLIGVGRLEQEGIESPGEYYALFLMSAAGTLIFCQAAELITLFIGLEIMSMALYALCGAGLTVKRSSESAMKYFFLGSFSSAFLLYGFAFLYGLTGTTVIPDIAMVIGTADQGIALLAVGLVLVGLAFKIGAVPFHFWAPDVYEGAPTPITAYMACVIKAASIGVALRVLWSGLGDLIQFWAGAVWLIAVLTMIIGNIVALRQRSVKRMLAYSSVAHAGYIMVAFLAPSAEYGGGAAILYYIIAYTVMTMGSFAIVTAISSAKDARSDDISEMHGLGYRRPFLGVTMSIFMLSLAGIPPGLAGLLGKFYIFNAAVKADYVGLAIIGVICSAISCYYYLRVIVAMYFIEPATETRAIPPTGVLLGGTLSVCALASVLFGLFPASIYDGAAAVISSL